METAALKKNLFIKNIFAQLLKKATIIVPTLFILVVVFVYFFVFYNLPNPASLKNYKAIPQSSHIYDRNGKLLYEVYHEQNRTLVKLKDLKPYVYQSTIAIEDKDFYHHGGISLVSGMLRAVRDMALKRNLQGGSTITQQLVKGALLTPDRTIRRKLREIVLAVWTEKEFTKDQILELYLNQVPYGGAAYGVEQAAQRYFDKHAKDLSLVEAATIAGLPQAPSLYSPYANPDLTVQRRNEVLKAMFEQKYITKDQYDKAINAKLEVKALHQTINAPHFVFYVKSQLEQAYGTKQIEEGGMNITTTLDLTIQKEAEKIVKDELEKVKDLNISNSALLVTRPSTGEILAMVGSADYFATGSGAFNVTTALRQPGSSIKPLNYAVGLDKKIVSPASVFLDEETCFSAPGQPKAYCPVNYDGKFHGPVQLRFALGNSFNIPAVKMLAMNGLIDFVASAEAYTIDTFQDPSHYGLSLTLGGGEVRMTEMAQAYSAFANRGKPRQLNSILTIKDNQGKILEQFKDPNLVKDVLKPLDPPNFFAIPGKNAVSQETAFLISHILLDNNARATEFGTGSSLVIPGKAVSVKTGTTNDIKDNWTIGYTPNFLVSVWVGNNDNTPMNPYLTSGITGAAPIWNGVMRFVLKNQPDLWPVKPENVIGGQVCADVGGLATKTSDGKDSCPTRFEYYIKGAEPKAMQVTKEQVWVGPDDKMVKSDFPGAQQKEKTVMKDQFNSVYCVDCAH